MAPTGEPRQSPKPQPMGDTTIVFLLCLCTLCIIFLIYRKADSLKRVVSHQLKTFSAEREGRIRLSEDGGPHGRSFVEDEEEDENSDDDDDDVLGPGHPIPRSTPQRR